MSFSRRTAARTKTWLIRKHFEKQIKAAGLRVGSIVVDAGCGDMPYRELIGRAGGEYFGIDRCSRHAHVLGDIACLPVASQCADTVVCLQVLDDVPEPLVALAEIARVLRPGGCLLLSANQSWRVHDAPHDYLRFTRFGLQYLCAKAGFNVEAIRPMGGLWALLAVRIVFRIHDFAGRSAPLLLLASAIGLFLQGVAALLDRVDYHPEDTQTNFVIATRS